MIVDDRTINRFVFAYGEVTTSNQAIEIIERQSDEKVTVVHLEPEALKRAAESEDLVNLPYYRSTAQYFYSTWARGDNQPEKAKFLGYLDAKELYPDLKPLTLEDTVRKSLINSYESEGSRPAEFWDGFEAELNKFKGVNGS